jgi:hypothetical protein
MSKKLLRAIRLAAAILLASSQADSQFLIVKMVAVLAVSALVYSTMADDVVADATDAAGAESITLKGLERHG